MPHFFRLCSLLSTWLVRAKRGRRPNQVRPRSEPFGFFVWLRVSLRSTLGPQTLLGLSCLSCLVASCLVASCLASLDPRFFGSKNTHFVGAKHTPKLGSLCSLRGTWLVRAKRGRRPNQVRPRSEPFGFFVWLRVSRVSRVSLRSTLTLGASRFARPSLRWFEEHSRGSDQKVLRAVRTVRTQ
jgi:hypothetical protein